MSVVGLISCVSKKHGEATTARNLYRSSLFAKSREYVERHCDTWFVLSAKYGLVQPNQIIEPYDETLLSKSPSERMQWAQRVWAELSLHLDPGDHVKILAGAMYREHLLPLLRGWGCSIELPMEGLGIGRQLQWLSKRLSQPEREHDLQRLYRILGRLERGVGGKRLLCQCTGQQRWPSRGVYVFFELAEKRAHRPGLRIVRVGTHAVSRGSKSTLWQRLRTHRGTGESSGNHRSSIFRLHVGTALARKDPRLFVQSWGEGQAADAETRKLEVALERAVSEYIGAMSVLWFVVQDEPDAASDRAYIERSLIGLVSGTAGPVDIPSPNWLGRYSPERRIRHSGLWNLNYIGYPYSRDFLDVLDEYVLITLGKKPVPERPIAPRGWYEKERSGVPLSQPSLFEDK